MVRCKTCGHDWPSRIYAEDCAEQDELEEDDRQHGRMFRSNRDMS